MLQVRHEDGTKIKRSLAGSVELMQSFQRDMLAKHRQDRKRERLLRHEARKKARHFAEASSKKLNIKDQSLSSL